MDTLRILMIEDRDSDAELVLASLRRAGLKFVSELVDNEADFIRALENMPDVILSDYSLPQFGALRALEIHKQVQSDAAFLIVSGTIGEEVAVDAMRAGATDYIMKDRLDRLGQAVRQAAHWRTMRAERSQLDRQLFLLNRAVSAASQGIVIADAMAPDFPVVFVNPTFTAITGYVPEDVLGRNCRMLQGPDTSPRAVDEIRAALREARSCSVDVLNYRKDGTTFWNNLSLSPVHDDAGVVTHFIGVQTDITQRKILEQQFLQSQKMEAIGRLAAGVAHDFNNLLTAILGYADFAMDGLVGDDPLHGDLQEIRDAAERAAQLTRQLLTFSRKQIGEPCVLELNGVICEMERMLRRIIGEDIELVTTLADNLKPIRADPNQLGQVVLNLSVNARDAMPQGGRLTIQTRAIPMAEARTLLGAAEAKGDYVCLQVSDEGCGMDQETLSRIFEPFFTTKRDGRGTGLGLPTVYGIVQQCAGEIRLESSPGKGTTFRICFPALAAEQLSTPRDAVDQAVGRGTETLLLVDDETQLAQLEQRILSGFGCRVLSASSPQEAILLCRATRARIDMLITDVVMPGMNGHALAAMLTEERPEMKVLYLSGYTDDEMFHDGKRSTDFAFLAKPFAAANLARKVREVLDA